MRTISLINLKGGVGKTVSAINIAHILAAVHKKKVLFIDNDKQGNASSFFGLGDYYGIALSGVLTKPDIHIDSAIQKTKYPNLDVIPTDISLLTAIHKIANDKERPQQTRLAQALDAVKWSYDYCVIDNPPDINLSVINALAATNDVLVPLKADRFSLDGLDIIAEQIENARSFNKDICFKGCFITDFRSNRVNKQSLEKLRSYRAYPVFKTIIRSSVKVSESTYTRLPLLIYAKDGKVTADYIALVEEYLSGVSDSDTLGRGVI